MYAVHRAGGAVINSVFACNDAECTTHMLSSTLHAETYLNNGATAACTLHCTSMHMCDSEITKGTILLLQAANCAAC